MHELFFYLALLIFGARLIGDLFSKSGLPGVLGEILVGILLGQSALGLIEINEVIHVLAEIGVILLLFQIGLEADIHQLKKVGLPSFIVAFIGAFVPMLLGTLVSYYFLDLSITISLFIGGTLTATSIGITVRVLENLRQLKKRFAQIVLGAAVLDDIFGVVVLTALAQFAREGKVNLPALSSLVFYIAIFFVLAPVMGQMMASFIQKMSKFLKTEDFIPPTIIALIFFFAYLAHLFHVEAILGAFTLGLALSRRFTLPFALFLRTEEKLVEKIEHTLLPLVWVLTPLFFAYIGLQLNLKTIDFFSPSFWLASLILLAIAFIGKVISGFFVTKKPKEATLIGISMLPRGEVGLIFAEVGRQTGIYNDFIYAILIFVIATTTLMAPILLKISLKERAKQISE